MEARLKLEEMVLELLGVHSCVTVPGLGSFIYRETQASSNTFTFELRPSLRTVFFNSSITADDGLLANHYREQNGLSFSQAQAQLAEAITAIKAGLEKSRNMVFGKLGNFFLNGDNQIFFFPSSSLNLSHETFGLPLIKLDELEKTKDTAPILTSVKTDEKASTYTKEETEAFEEAEVLFVVEPTPRKRSWIWKVAAAIAILMLAGTGTYFGRKLFTSDTQRKQTQAAIDTPVTQDATAQPLESESARADNAPASTETPLAENVTEPEASPMAKPAVPAAVPEISAAKASSEKPESGAMEQLQSAKGKYFVVGGKYMDENLAQLECRGWMQKNIQALVYKAENSSLYKVILQRFTSAEAAQSFASALPSNTGAPVSVKELKNFK